MDATERWFKVALDIVATALVARPLLLHFRSSPVWVVSCLVAHTLNFLFNGHLWGVLKHYGIGQANRASFESYLAQLARRTGSEPSILWAGVYGSLVRDKWTPTSDLDIRLVRKAGVTNALRACIFVLGERSRALIHRFPLDIYVLDSPEKLSTMREDGWALTTSSNGVTHRESVRRDTSAVFNACCLRPPPRNADAADREAR